MIKNENIELSGKALLPFNSFLKQNGRTASCGWHWRKKGWIATVNIAGRLYVTQDEITRFQQRVAAGEFAKGSPAVFVYDDPLVETIKKGRTADVQRETDKPEAVTGPAKPVGSEADNQTAK
jgi:hypothetical protein